jgi:hypothetical protein
MSIKPITLILTKLSITNNKPNPEAEPEPIEPKKRGRPKKNTITTNEDREKLIEPKKRGRPKKNNTVVLINREEVTEPKEAKEPKKRGRPKKNQNLTIANDTSSESSCENNEPKKRGRPKKIETIETKEDSEDDSEEESDESSDSDSEDNGQEVEGFYIKLDKNAAIGYTFVSSVSESEYIIRSNFKLYNPHTFMYCGTWDPVRVRAPALKPTNE